MARLSIDDLNNLSGVSSVDLDTLHKTFTKAYTKILNDIHRWVNDYNSRQEYFKRVKVKDLYYYNKQCDVFRSLYYTGSIIFDNIDLFDKTTLEYQSLLDIIGNNKRISEIRVLKNIMYRDKVPMINGVSNCYGLYQEAYKVLNKEE